MVVTANTLQLDVSIRRQPQLYSCGRNVKRARNEVRLPRSRLALPSQGSCGTSTSRVSVRCSSMFGSDFSVPILGLQGCGATCPPVLRVHWSKSCCSSAKGHRRTHRACRHTHPCRHRLTPSLQPTAPDIYHLTCPTHIGPSTTTTLRSKARRSMRSARSARECGATHHTHPLR